jgi:hypothetical protein
MKKENKIEAVYAQQQEKIPQTSGKSEEVAIGGRIKKQRSRTDMSSEKAAELLSHLSQTHMAAVMQANQHSSRTVEEYSNSGLRAHDIKTNDLNEFPPVGFALPTFELEESPSAWESPTFVPERGRTIKEGNNGG